jgi:hypothetical protein
LPAVVVVAREMAAAAANFDIQALHHHGFLPLVRRFQFKLVAGAQVVIPPQMELHQLLLGVALLVIEQMVELVAADGRARRFQQEEQVDQVAPAQRVRQRVQLHPTAVVQQVLVQRSKQLLQTGLAGFGL